MKSAESQAAYMKAYYTKNREQLLAKQRERGKAHYQANKEQVSAKNKAWREANPERMKELQARHRAENSEALNSRSAAWYRNNRRKVAATTQAAKLRKYGLTLDAHKAILDRQEHQCPICERFLAYPTVPAIDHSHVTGSVRGVLCRRCNTALGLLEDSPANLERALEYLSISRLVEFHRWLSGVTSTTSSAPSSAPSTPPA